MDPTEAQRARSIEVSEKAFGREFNEALVHQVSLAYMAAARARHQAPAQQGRAPWPVVGSRSSQKAAVAPCRLDPQPDLVGGGRAFAARPRDSRRRSTARCTAAR